MIYHPASSNRYHAIADMMMNESRHASYELPAFGSRIPFLSFPHTIMGFEQLADLKKQLAAKAKTERPAQPQAKPKSAPRRQQENPVDPVVLTIGKLQRLFPKAFPKNPAPKLPLKIGIHKELLGKAGEIGLEEAAITEAVKTWCRGTRYWASIVEGAPRIDLEGNTAGEVSARDAAQARSLEARRRQPRKPKAEAGAGTEAQQAVQATDPTLPADAAAPDDPSA